MLATSYHEKLSRRAARRQALAEAAIWSLLVLAGGISAALVWWPQ